MDTIHICSRRRFVASTAGTGLLAAFADPPGLDRFPRVTSADVRQVGDTVRFASDIEPTVRFLEETPRSRLIEELVSRINKGLSYQELVSALFLAGVRNIPGASPAHHRNVGGALHSVFVIYSTHWASLNCSEQQRWFPMLWAADELKRSQSHSIRDGFGRDVRWRMPPLVESAVPSSNRARADLILALDNWDEEAAELAAAGLARTASANDVFNLLCRYGARDYRYIGHKAIYVANAWRTLQCIGWRHAEPVVRSLARALAAYYHQEGHPADADLSADRSWRHNLEAVEDVRAGWQTGAVDQAASEDLLASMRYGSDIEASRQVVESLNRATSPRSVWDAITGAVCETVMRQPDFNSLHAVTTVNALHYAYQTVGETETRLLIMLQAAAFTTMFRDELNSRIKYDDRIDELEPLELDSSGVETIDEILAALSVDRRMAARKTLASLDEGGDARLLMRCAQELLNRKVSNVHDYKYASAVFEDYWSLSNPWKRRQLASTMFLMRTPAEADASVIRRIEAAVG
jgi:hypothetical protein